MDAIYTELTSSDVMGVKPMRFISTTDLMDPNWDFLAPYSENPNLIWETHSGQPRNMLERGLTRPHIGRWRAALSAARSARSSLQTSLLVSHLPYMGGVTNVLRRQLCPEVPQIAFAFNFTDLPSGRRLAKLRKAYQGIEEFVVFSRYEIGVYSDLFDIPSERFSFLPWAMDTPVPGPENPVGFKAPYLCSIGGEGRDYALLARAMRALPHINMAIVARPYSIAGVDFPSNVEVFTNLSLPKTWALAASSEGMVIPLKTDKTACGHITLVGAQKLGVPLVVTRSVGVEDYVSNGISAGDLAQLKRTIEALYSGDPEIISTAKVSQSQAVEHNSPQVWLQYFKRLAERFEKLVQPEKGA
ncbi:MAG: hypothetical protein ACI9Y1_000704 [Lentisphaeria bacterium]